MPTTDPIQYDKILLQARRLRAEKMREIMATLVTKLFSRNVVTASK